MGNLHVKLRDEDHRELKAEAARRGKTIMEAVAEAVRDWVRRAQG